MAQTDIVPLTSLIQQYETVVSTNQLAQDPQELAAYTTAQKERLKASIVSAKQDAFNKVFTDANQASDTSNNIYYYYQRSKEAADANDKLLNVAAQTNSAASFNSDLAKRQFEINEWAVGNKRDTLFVFQFMFITLLVLAIITGLWKYGLIPTGVFGLLTFFLFFVLACTIAYRALYTDGVRNKYYWSRRAFGKMPTAIAPTPDCPTLTNLANELRDEVVNLPTSARGYANRGLSSLGSALSTAGSTISRTSI
jgi:hypothetical protein